MPLNDLISKAKSSKLYSTISKVVSTIDRDKEKEGFQLVPGGTSGAIQRVKQSFNDPGQYSITRGFSNIVPNTKTALTPFLGQQTASNIAYGLRGATQLTPFQAVNSLGIDKVGQFNYQSSAPQTQQEKDAQQIGRATYGLALTAPLGGANMVKNVLGRVVTGVGVGSGLGAGISAVTGGDIKQGAKQGAMSGYSFAPLGAITNPITSKLLVGAPTILQNQIGQRAIGGVANVVEDELQGMIDGYDTDTQSRITSLLVGAALTGNKDAWNLTKRKLKSLNVKNADDLIKVAETRLSDAYKDQGAIRLSWLEPDGSRRAVTVDKATQPGWIMYLNNRGVDYKLNFVGGSLGSVGGAPKPPTDPTEALKVEDYVLPKDIPVYQEAKAIGAKRIAPDRIPHQQLTPDAGIKALVDKQKQRLQNNANSWVTATKKIDDLIKKYGEKLPQRTEKNIQTYPGLIDDHRTYQEYKKYAWQPKNLTDIKTQFERRANVTNAQWTPEAEAKAFESAKKDYIELIKSDISKGYKYPDSVLDFDRSFRIAENNRARYEKGLRTSFSSDDQRIVIEDIDKIGGGMKRQDGKPITDSQKETIKKGVVDFANTMGIDIARLAKDDRWVYVHLNGKNPFLTAMAGGLYRKGANNVSISVSGSETFKKVVDGKEVFDRVHTTMAHELGHALDGKVDKRLFDSQTIWSLRNNFNPIEWMPRGDKYWKSQSEITARMIEQYNAVKKGNTNLFDREGYWKKDVYEQIIEPAVERAINTHFADYKLQTPLELPKSQLTDIYNQSQLPKSEAIKGKAQSQPPELTKQVAQTTSSPSLDTTRTGNIPTTQVKQAQTLPIQQDSRLTGVDTKLGTNQNLKIKTTKVSSNESIPPTLKPKTQLLKQAEELRNTGFQELIANRELAQLNQVKREMFTSKQIEDINRLKAIARSNKALEGDIETLRKLTPDGLTDKVLEYVEEATAIKGQGNEEQLLETALSLPTKADTKVKLPVEIKNARELEKQASKLRDLVYNSETDPNIKAKAVADNQKVIQKSAISDYKEWEKQLFKQESAKRMTPNRQATIASSQIRTSTKPEFAKPESIAKTQDISNAGKGMTDIYRNVDRVFGKDSQVRKQILAPFDTAKASMVDDLEREATGLEKNIVKKYGFTKGSAESEYIQKYGEGLVTKPQLIERFGKKKAEQIVEANTWFRSQYDRLLDEVNAVRARIYPNNPEKQIPKRKDYYRHFQDLSSSLAGLKNLFENPAGIEPGLAGVSEYTLPKSKWLSFAQKRLGMKTEYDAVGGYLDYVGSQTYAKRIDPFIEKFRTLRQELVDATSVKEDKNYGKLNNFIEFLDDYANDLAGKTNPADRVAQKYMGRKVFKILNWVNSRTKANVIVGNLSSSIAQFFNIPQGIAEAGVVNSGKGAVRTLGSILDNTNTPITKSEFIKTRFSKDISDRFDVGVLSSVKKAASWITGVGDEIGTKLIWNSVYEKAISQNIENPIKYADDITRKMVAGRGIGEVPLLQKSKTFQLLAPFQLEVSNVWHVMRDWAGEKSANKFVTFFVASYLMNRMAERIRGNDVSLDPIQAGLESIEAYSEEDDKTLGVLRAGGRLFGEVLSNLPGGQTVAAMYPEYGATIGDTKLPTREKLFGEGDPTRFGSGLLASKGLTDPLYKILPPYGGAQIKKTIEGLSTINKGYSESKTGRIRFPVDNNLINTVQAGAFGQYSVPEAREYFGNETSTLGDKQSESFKTILTTQGKEAATNFYNGILRKRGKDVELQLGESSNDITVIESKFENTPDLLTNDEIATFYEAKITKPKSANRYEKAIYEKDIWSKASDINSRESLSQEQKDGAITKLLSNIGVSKEDYDYYQVAKEDVDLKTLKVYDVYDQTKDYDEFMKYLVNGRKPVNGKILISDGVIDNLVDDGLIPYALGKDLKSIDLNEDGSVKTGKIRAKSSKAKTDSIKAYSNALERLGDSLLKINIKAPTFTSTSTNKINTKGLTFSSAGL